MDYLRQQRIYKAFLLFLLLFLFNLGRIYYIQVTNYQKYASKMMAQDTMTVNLEKYARGNIYDRNMVPLTGAVIKNKVIVFPAIIKENKVTIRRLARILQLTDEKMIAKIGKLPHYLELEKDLTAAQALAITKAELPGIRVAPVTMRDAKPLLAAHTLGYLEDNVGKAGLENLYEKELKGRPEKVMRAYVDGNGQLISGLGYRVGKNVDVNRRNLVLTIDKRVQQVVENVMNSKVKRGAVVVMDSFSGDILAIAGGSQYEINGYNPAVDFFEPGSVFKIVVASAALEEGMATPNSYFLCKGNKDIIKCSEPAGHGNITLSEAMAKSCNSTFVKVGINFLKAPKLIDYARRFGLENQKITGYPVELYREKITSISGDVRNSSIGQGPVLISPVQITAMSAVIANGGIYRQPRLVKELTNSRGQVTKRYPVATGTRVISAKTAAQVNEMLTGVVNRGTGKEAAIAQGSAGKTGTAEAGKGGTYAWFTGYVPNNPKYVVTVFIDGGSSKISGSKDAAPVFKEIMENIMKLP